MTVYRSARALRDYLISVDEAARLIYVDQNRIRTLAREGYIKPGRRKGFYRLGDVVDGHAEAVRMGAVKPPHERRDRIVGMTCEVNNDARISARPA